MTVICVPPVDDVRWPTLGPQVCEWIESGLPFGPGDLRGQPLRLNNEQRAFVYRAYELHPICSCWGKRLCTHRERPGRRRFNRVALSLRKGLMKTELGAALTAAELHPEGPVRCVNWWKPRGGEWEPEGGPVNSPYIPVLATTEEQVEDLGFGVLLDMLGNSRYARDFDLGLERIARWGGDGVCQPMSTAPNSKDGALTTYQWFDEPLALTTPVPTTDGWKALGDVAPGDHVYDRHGGPVAVVGVSPVHVGRECFRVQFVDGDEIVTDANHRWKVIDWRNRPAGEHVKTTVEMYRCGVETGYGKRWRLPRADGYDGSETKLLIDPYVLGLWLGDGATNAGYIHAGDEDAPEIMALVEQCGYPSTVSRDKRPGGVRFLPRGLRAQLRAASLLGHKHIPSRYMWACRRQRLALLQGLMDSDGYATPKGHCTFVQGSREMAESVQLLVRSLGEAASLCEQGDARSRTGSMFKIHFTPSFTPFRLARKVGRCPTRQIRNAWWPTIASIESCASEPVRCLAVDSDDHLFVVGTGLRLTHNTHRVYLPTQKHAHQTMLSNMAKRPIADPWSLETTTAYSPGQGSIAEDTMDYGRKIAAGKAKDTRLFFFHREASPEHDIATPEGLRAALIDASGPEAAQWSDIDRIAAQWNDPSLDKQYLERVWTNRATGFASRAFPFERWKALARPEYRIPKGALVTLGFDGSRVSDATGLVATEVATGFQQVVGHWENTAGVQDWRVRAGDVTPAVELAFEQWEVWRLYFDPPYWEEEGVNWAGRWGEKVVVEFKTNRWRLMGEALRPYRAAMEDGTVTNDGHAGMAQHIGNAVRSVTNIKGAEGELLWVIQKERDDSPFKIDLAVAGCLSWQARLDAVAAGATASPGPGIVAYFPGPKPRETAAPE